MAEENDKKVERYVLEKEYYPYFSLNKVDDGDFDSECDASILIDKDIVEIFKIIENLMDSKQQILQFLYEDTDLRYEKPMRKSYDENLDYLNKRKELFLKIKGSE